MTALLLLGIALQAGAAVLLYAFFRGRKPVSVPNGASPGTVSVRPGARLSPALVCGGAGALAVCARAFHDDDYLLLTGQILLAFSGLALSRQREGKA